jgi:hypothetical protein
MYFQRFLKQYTTDTRHQPLVGSSCPHVHDPAGVCIVSMTCMIRKVAGAIFQVLDPTLVTLCPRVQRKYENLCQYTLKRYFMVDSQDSCFPTKKNVHAINNPRHARWPYFKGIESGLL